ncbi:MAG: 30S ribosomal protein S7, partial [Candidatus Aminicenantales bacterium]
MPRRGTIKKRKAPADSLYGSTLVARFINLFLRKGKKTTAERVVYGT